MNRKFIFVLGILLFLGFVSVNCSAQSSTNDQRIVGTWISTLDDGSSATLVFNANGSGTLTNLTGVRNFTYGISISGEIIFVGEFNKNSKYYFSPDGRTLIMFTNEIYRKK